MAAEDRAAMLREAVRLKRAAARDATAKKEPDLPARPADPPPTLGELQRALWLTHQVDPDSPAYHLVSAWRAEGDLDPEALRQAVTAVMARHRILRSTFRHREGEVVQVVDEASELPLTRLDAGPGEAEALAVARAQRPFDLREGPLLRLLWVDEEGAAPLIALTLHHILADERSLGILWREIGEAYAGRLTADEPTRQYDDFVYAQGQGDPRREKEQIEGWRQRLDPWPDELRLPFEKPAGENEEAAGRLLLRPLPAAARQGMNRLAAATGTTPFQAYAFAFRLLLQRYAEGRPVAFATPVSTRSHSATAEMVGYFSNPVVIAETLDEERSVKEALAGFGDGVRDALAAASLPFQTLIESLDPPRQPDRHPLFQAMFVYQQTATPPPLGAARLRPVTLDLGASKFDLTLFVGDGEGPQEIAVEYRTDRYDEVWMERLLGHYAMLLEALAADASRPLAEVSLLGSEEAEEIRGFATGEALPPDLLDLLPQQLMAVATRDPDAPAVVTAERSTSYRELAGLAMAISRRLAEVGVGPGGRVAIYLQRSAWMIAALLGSHGAGAAYVPLDPAYPEARNRDILEDAQVAAVLTTAELAKGLPKGAWEIVDVEGLDAADLDGEPALLHPTAAEDLAYLLYTSGSTGRPKGAMIDHGNLRASTAARLRAYDRQPRRYLLIPSVAFDSSVAGIFWALAVGGALVVPAEDEVRDPRRLARLIEEAEVDSLLCVPSLYAEMLRSEPRRLEGLAFAIVAGESCSSRLVEEHFQRLPHVRLFNEYGPTEATVWASLQELTSTDARRGVAIGHPIPGLRVDVLDALGRPVPAGIPGEAWIVGPTVARGYWRRPDLTEERFDDGEGDGNERRYRTGDRVAWALDGRLLFLGRQDDQIKLRGHRIEPAEVEAALLEDPRIEEAAVLARSLEVAQVPSSAGPTEGTDRPDFLVAFVQTDQGAEPEGWRQALAERLPAPLIPSRLVALVDLPRLPNGKVDRRSLQRLPLAESEEEADEPAVVDDRQQALISLWEGLLGRYGIRPGDNFFELGGHSLLVVELTLAIERDFGLRLTSAEVFESPTVAELAARLEQRDDDAAPPYRHLFPLQPRGAGRPFVVAVPHFFSPTFAARFRGERPVYGLRGVSLRQGGNGGLWRTMEELGAELADEIQRRFPDEAVFLAGYSFGASMAFEAARLLEERGAAPGGLYLIAPMALDLYRLGPVRLQLDGLRKPLNEVSTGEALRRYAQANQPFRRQPWARLRQRLLVDPWRRLLSRLGQWRRRRGLPLTHRILHADVRAERFRLHKGYRPGTVEVPTVIFDSPEAETDAAATWRPHFRGPLRVVPTPDPHLGDEAVEAARRVILAELEQLEERQDLH